MHAMTNMTSTNGAANAGQWEEGRTQEILVFHLGDERYGIDIQKVQALRAYHNVAPVADAPDFIKGVIDLHGATLPVIDMRIKFNVGACGARTVSQADGMRPEVPAAPLTDDRSTAVIVLGIAGYAIGIVVDRVLETIKVGTERIRPVPEIGTADNDDRIGMSTIDDHKVILLDMEKLMSSGEMRFAETLARS